MSRQRAIFFLVVFGAVIALAAAYSLLPNTYRIAEHLGSTTAFWNEKEAFLFLQITTEGRATNIVQEKLAATRYGAWALVLGMNGFRIKQDVAAYHLLPAGKLDRFNLPAGSGVYGSWSVQRGKLQFTPFGNPRSHLGDPQLALRWDGQKFVSEA